jgi:hypothetical protein
LSKRNLISFTCTNTHACIGYMYNYYSTKSSAGEHTGAGHSFHFLFLSLGYCMHGWHCRRGIKKNVGIWVGSAFFSSSLSTMVTSFLFPFCIYISGLSSIHYFFWHDEGMGCMDWIGLGWTRCWDEGWMGRRRCERLYLVLLVLGCMNGVDWEKDGLWLCFFLFGW